MRVLKNNKRVERWKNIHEVTLTKYAAKAGVIKFGTWGSRGIEQLHITALPPWNEAAVITVTFVNGRVQSEPQVFPESMTIDVPQAATSAATKSRASCKMVFKGIDQSGAVVYSTDLPYTVLNRTDIDGAEYDPGENAFEQYIRQVGAYRDTALNAANSARNSELSAEEYAENKRYYFRPIPQSPIWFRLIAIRDGLYMGIIV